MGAVWGRGWAWFWHKTPKFFPTTGGLIILFCQLVVLYGNLQYVCRLDYLWDHVRRSKMEIPEFVRDHDEDLEYRPMMDYSVESDHPRVYGAPAVDSSVAMYSTRCIS
ncbi:hypothetical protein HanOQP8_Chr17g0674361 [Helianthus annuus]|nr:hypothetical protein HanOQP8_Chr17g0674361 [Helianthus annuus]